MGQDKPSKSFGGRVQPKLQKIFAAGIASILGLLFAVALLEIGLRIHNPIHVPLRAYDIALPVNQVFTAHHEDAVKLDPEIVLHHNSLGFRGPEMPDDFDGATTVLTIGGSTTACVGLTEEHAWPHLVLRRLSEQDSNLWLNNAGLNGHSTFGHLMLLRQVVRHLKPDYVVYLIGINDVGRADLNKFDRGVDPNHASGLASLIRHSELLSTLQVLWRSFRAYDLGLARNGEIDFETLGTLEYDPAHAQREIEAHHREHVPKYEARVRMLISESRAAGIEPILVTQPAVYGAGTDPETGRDLSIMDVDGSAGLLKWQVLDLYNEATRRVAADEDVALIDASRLMPKDTRLYTDFIHYSAAGARKMADIIATSLEEEVLPD